MATLLYRLGRYSFRHAWRVVGVWVVLVIAAAATALTFGGQTQESFAIPGTESQAALDRLEEVFPAVAGGSAQVLVQAPASDSVVDDRAAIDEMATVISGIDGISSVTSPFDERAANAVSKDGRVAVIRVQFDDPSSEVTDGTIARILESATIGESAGLRVEFGGPVFKNNQVGITVVEIIGVVFAGVVLVVTFGSLLAAGMPLLTAIVGVGVVMSVITTVSAFTTVSSSAPLLALMIGLAVGIDYSLFILSRHRTQLARGETPEESTAGSVATAGSAVVVAGLTVIIALLALLVVDIPFLSVMGVGAAVAVLIAIGVATTLLPALFGLAKTRLAPRAGSRSRRRAQPTSDPTAPRTTLGARWVRGVTRRRVPAAIAVVVVLGTLAIPALSIDLNLPDGGSEPEGSTQREAYDLVAASFGPGFNGPLLVTVDLTDADDIPASLGKIGDRFRDLDDVAFVSPGFPDDDLQLAIVQVTPTSAPDSIETKRLVQAIRALAPELESEFGTPIAVTGATALAIDVSARLTDALLPFGVIVVVLTIVLLTVVFRSILVPVTAALGFVLSVTASFGVVVAVFQWGWFADIVGVENPGPIISFMPIILMAVLFGLTMDYEVFLVSGMREEYTRSHDASSAVSRGFANGARVVTAAALIMTFVFLAFVPGDTGSIKPIALGLAVGIALDAFLVRMTLVPALMSILGDSAWWLPRWLGRVESAWPSGVPVRKEPALLRENRS